MVSIKTVYDRGNESYDVYTCGQEIIQRTDETSWHDHCSCGANAEIISQY